MIATDTIGELLYKAAQWRARLNNPYVLESNEDALDAVRGFMAVEEKILILENAQEILQKLLIVPLDTSAQNPNHAMMAGLILARSGLQSSPHALLRAANHEDVWCATQARLNLNWLALSDMAAEALRAEILSKNKSDIPLRLLIEALIHQRRVIDFPVIEEFISGEYDEAERSLVLATYVGLFPEHGLHLAQKLTNSPSRTLATTALGIRTVFGNEEDYDALLEHCDRSNKNWHTALHWLGRTLRLEALPALLEGLSHPDPEIRADVVTSLAWYGDQTALKAVIDAMDDLDKVVSDQAVSLILYWLGDAAANFTQNWRYDGEGRLASDSRHKLATIAHKLVDELKPGLRYMPKGELLEAEYFLNNLYLGIQPEHSWYHWVAMTGAYGPYGTHMDILYNYPTLEDMENWLLKHRKAE